MIKRMGFFTTALTLMVSILLVLGAVFFGGCGNTAPEPEAPPAPTPEPEPTPTPEPEPETPTASAAQISEMRADWETGAHNNTYDLGKGPNTFCARCHSPQNWDPAAAPGPPPSCITCKFPFDKEVRIAANNPLIEEADWKVIGCEVCHQVDGDQLNPTPMIWNNASASYDEVLTTTHLCEKCHTDSINGTRHKMALGGGAHSNQIGMTADRPTLCTDCHNQHTLQADCEECHTDIRSDADHIQGKNALHMNVDCVACHDASEMDVGFVGETNVFTTGKITAGRGGDTFEPAYSHDFNKSVDCARCHYEENPWGRTVIESSSARG